MAAKGGPENKDEVQPIDASRDFEEEKIRMKTAKATMTRTVRRLETALADNTDLKSLEIENKDFVGIAKEVSESMNEAKIAYKKMEEINTRLAEKLVMLNRIGKVADVDKALGDLSEAMDQYWSKYEAVRSKDKLILMEVDVAMRSVGTGAQTVSTSGSNSDFVLFRPAPDTRPGFLERESSMLEALAWIEQATYYVKSGFKNKPPQEGSLVHLQALINPTWLQAIEAMGAKTDTLETIMGEEWHYSSWHWRRRRGDIVIT